MSVSFDPYVQWLGIRDPQRPPNHYRLLGVDPFESDPNVLASAADRQMAHVRTFQIGRHSVESQKLLNELAAAKICLLSPEKKAEYDAWLRAFFVKQPAGEAEAGVSPTPLGAVEPAAAGPPLPSGPAAVGDGPPAFPTTPVDLGETVLVKVSQPAPAPATTSSPGKESSTLVSTTITVLVSMVLVLAGLVGWAAMRSWWGEEKSGPNQITARGDKAFGKQPRPDTSEPETPKPETPKSETPKPEPPEPDTPEPDTPKPDTPEADVPEPETAGPDTPEPSEAKRLPIPPEAAQLETVSEIRELFKEEYAQAKERTRSRDLATMLLRKGQETKDDLTARYVLFTEARDQAVAAGEAELFLKTVTLIGKEYSVDWLEMATETLQKAAGRTRETGANKALAEHVLDRLVAEAVAKDEYDMAAILAETARDMARACKPRELELVKRAVAAMREVDALRQQYEAFLQADQVLAGQPDDPRANLTAGSYYCFVKSDFARGLPMLLKGNEPILSGLAQAELARPTEPAEMISLADRWYDASEKAAESIRQGLQNRAADWYERALPGLSGLSRDRVEHRLAELRGG